MTRRGSWGQGRGGAGCKPVQSATVNGKCELHKCVDCTRSSTFQRARRSVDRVLSPSRAGAAQVVVRAPCGPKGAINRICQ